MSETKPARTSDRLSGDEVARLHAGFRSVVDSLAPRMEAAPAFWFTWLSSRDRLNPRLWDRLVALTRLRRALDQGTPPPPWGDPALAPYVEALAQARGQAAPVADPALRPPPRRPAWLAVPRRAVWFLWWWWRAMRLPKARIAKAPDVVLVSILSAAPLGRPGPYRDTYFGDLRETLAADGQTALYCGLVTDRLPTVMGALATRRAGTDDDAPVTTLAEHLRPWDFVVAVATAWTARFDVPAIPWDGLDLAPLVRDDLDHDRPSIIQGVLLRRAFRRLMKRWSNARFLQMWENNPWERALYLAARETGARCDGYLHTVVIPAHIKYALSRAEHGRRPMPERVLCAGEGSARLLETLGDYPPGTVVAACMLRDTLPSAPPRRTPLRRPARRLLVVLEGLPTMVDLLRFAASAAAELPDHDVAVRPHPVLGLDVLAPMAGISMAPGQPLRDASGCDFTASLDEVDVVIYQGSMAAMTALFLGLPVIKFQADETLEDDPLAGCPSPLHATVADLDGLRAALKRLDALDDDAHGAAVEEARRFVLGLMSQPDDATLRPFLAPKKRD